MNHIIKGIIIVVAITSILAVGATSMTPIFRQGNAQAPTILSINFNCISCQPNYPFPITITNINHIIFSGLLPEGPTSYFLHPGSFAVSPEDNRNPSYSGVCKGTISAGQNLYCTIQLDFS